jgi:hypothetical protein
MRIEHEPTLNTDLKLVFEKGNTFKIWVSTTNIKGWKLKQVYNLRWIGGRMSDIGHWYLEKGNPKKGGIQVRISIDVIIQKKYTALGVAAALYRAGEKAEAIKVLPDIDKTIRDEDEKVRKDFLEKQAEMRARWKGRQAERKAAKEKRQAKLAEIKALFPEGHNLYKGDEYLGIIQSIKESLGTIHLNLIRKTWDGRDYTDSYSIGFSERGEYQSVPNS